MAVDSRFVVTGAKRVFDSRPMYAQVVVTDDCNLTCRYCDEYTPGGPSVPIAELKKRIDELDELGVLVYDFLGGEPLLHRDLPAAVSHAKSKRGGSNLATVITNGFFITKDLIADLNASGLDCMQLSLDSVEPTAQSKKSLKTLLPRLRLLAAEAKFVVEVQTVLNEETLAEHSQFRDLMAEFPFAFGFSVMHGPGGRIAIRGERFVELLRQYGVFEGTNFYGKHLEEMLAGDFSRPWKCLAGFKFLYVTAKGSVQWCAQQRDYSYPLEKLDLAELRSNNRHKPCEPGCCLGCVRMVSHSLGEPLKSLRSSIPLAASIGAALKRSEKAPSSSATPPSASR